MAVTCCVRRSVEATIARATVLAGTPRASARVKFESADGAGAWPSTSVKSDRTKRDSGARIAARLTALPRAFDTRTRKLAPKSLTVTVGMVSLGPFAPGMGTPFRNHWKDRGSPPRAPTEKTAVWPSPTVVSTGWRVKVGAWPGVGLGV